MSKLGKLSFPPSKLHLLLVLFFATIISCQSDKNTRDCHPSSCGEIQKISHPFRLKDDPKNCGRSDDIELSCENNRTILESSWGTFYVKEIDYFRKLVRAADAGVIKGNCSSFPINNLGIYAIIASSSKYYLSLPWQNHNTPVVFIRCKAPAKSSLYVDTTLKYRIPSSNSITNSSYVHLGDLIAHDVEDSCHISLVSWVAAEFQITNRSFFPDIHDALAYGFLLRWKKVYFISLVELFEVFGTLAGLYLAAKFVLGIPPLLVLIIYKTRRWHLSMFENIEDFLQGSNNLTPIRYTYSDIRKMTNNLSEKLGEGGFGAVFKGKLRSGPLAAVKILGKTKASGQEFISEVATIGRIHHINVVKLIGFCVERSKRALVYEFMPNGSLEKYIFSEEGKTISLSCQKMFEIALGVARGIDYLHRGCDMQILHFDIKPHNILLDENFTPRVSDFGLAKLYPTENSIVSLTAARGTLGYMAPELFYKNIGGVSYKADVYSFGMLLMEMAGNRKNLNPFVDRTSQIHFPSWVYDQLSEGNDIEMGEASEDKKKMVKKMILVALWCIQMKPTGRPSMSRVIEMLEGDLELLEMPPKPFQSPLGIPDEDDGIDADATEFPLLSADSLNSTNEDASQTL